MTERATFYGREECDVRAECLVPVLLNSIQVLAPRPTLGKLRCCGFECVGTVSGCPKRRRINAGTERPEDSERFGSVIWEEGEE